MRTSRFSVEQIALALRQVDAGTPVADICRKLEIAEATFYRWKRKFGDLGVSELRELRQLRDENRRLKGVVADLTLDKQILQESLRKKLRPRRSGGAGSLGCGRPFGSRRAARAGRPGCGARCSRTRALGRPRTRCGGASGSSPRSG